MNYRSYVGDIMTTFGCKRNIKGIMYRCLVLYIVIFILGRVLYWQYQSAENTQDQDAPFIRKQGNSSITKVILLTYYRGGSTLLSHTLNRNRNIMHLYEPMLIPFNQYKQKSKIKQMGDVYFDPNTFQRRDLGKWFDGWVEDLALNLLNCNYEKVPKELFYKGFFLAGTFGYRLHDYKSCMNQPLKMKGRTPAKKKIADRRKYAKLFPLCKDVLIDTCRKIKVRSFKTIRMTLQQVWNILHIDPNVKVIYYSRDPRGMLSSRIKVAEKIHTGFNRVNGAGEMCQRITQDMIYLDRILRDFPENIFVTNYETLTSDIRGTTADIYKFIGIDIVKEVEYWIKKQTKMRENGSLNNQTSKWKAVLRQEDISLLSKECKIGIK